MKVFMMLIVLSQKTIILVEEMIKYLFTSQYFTGKTKVRCGIDDDVALSI